MKEKNKEIQDKPESALFRKEVLNRVKSSYYGKVVIVSPISFLLWSVGVFSLTIVLMTFLYFGEYTKRYEVQGVLIPDKGVINIYGKKPGVILDQFIKQGDTVKAGQLLYSISTVQHTLANKNLSEQQREIIRKQIDIQKNRISILGKNYERYNLLLKKHLISEAEHQKHLEAYLSAKSILFDLEYRLSQISGEDQYAIRAHENGKISVLTTMIGDQITENTLLASIIPEDAELQGVLYVPTNAIGFVKLGQKVLLKYQAYPYQQFGLYEATIEYIEKIFVPR